ncbi:hypothetical protein JIN85_07765 [Luteolibacter pohnpeiensis]|uniref:DUF975 family protein n=1 Tax=Luteolibacter pohnpeiensis TaxID=454153 RepID=A0A934VQN9_9BACT|nr:hypothetical protein [Luteolibacter pohnpeiensis]MBK1882306.1 hypothetical protein [Luteolibacter pohnpeiensis]
MSDWHSGNNGSMKKTASTNPYAAPDSSFAEPEPAPLGEALQEIPPGSDPLNVWLCVKRGFKLTKRNYLTLILTISVIFIIYLVSHHFLRNHGLLGTFAIQLIVLYFTLCIKKVCLNAVSGRVIRLHQVLSFGVPRYLKISLLIAPVFAVFDSLKYLPVPMILYWIILLLILGFYIPYGFFTYAIIDRNMGVLESLRYSAKITTFNRPNVFILWMASVAVIAVGIMAIYFGILFTYPVAILANAAAYRWLQYGDRALLDHPGTKIPMLSSTQVTSKS